MTELFTRDSDGKKFKKGTCGFWGEILTLVPYEPKRIIDMSKVAGSDVLCEFSDNLKCWDIGKLTSIVESSKLPYRHFNDLGYKSCRIWDGWQAWVEPGECPLPEGVAFEVKAIDTDGNRFWVTEGKAVLNKECWRHGKGAIWITAYRATGTLPGWYYAHEAEASDNG